MDNMLYIVAGLVIILLIAVLILRRQKAQPPAHSVDSTTKEQTKYSPTPTDTLSNTAAVTKFDDLTVAERFLEQQRYDKAIEVLERGLTRKPHDVSILLKLLNVYALTKKPEQFYSTYDTISAHGDAATIAKANELKSLIDQEHDQTSQILANNKNNADSHTANTKEGLAEYESLDFDVEALADEQSNRPQNDSHSATQDALIDLSTDDDLSSAELESSLFSDRSESIDEQALAMDSPKSDISDATAPVITQPSADYSFDLTLDDLESDTTESEADGFDLFATDSFDNASTDVDTLDHAIDELDLENFNLDSRDTLAPSDPLNDTSIPSESSRSVEPDDHFIDAEDFNFDFDTPSTLDASVEMDELDFVPIDKQDDQPLDDRLMQEALDQEGFIKETPEEDFVLDLDDNSLDLDETAVDDSLNADTVVTSDDITPTADLTDSDFELVLEDEPSEIVTKSAKSDLLFDDNTPLDELYLADDIDLTDELLDADNAATTETPVVTEEQNAISDFAAQFAADFDFVNDLDNNQVTLDLATKYLELGEYDSAKRLLTEVIAQGSHEQQAQAQALLARTA